MTTVIKQINEQSIEEAKKILLSGGVIGMPTETVYGLAAVGTNADAVKEIFKIKGRPSDNPLIAHVHSDYDLNKLVFIEQEYVYELIKKFTPGPLTMVFNSKGVVCKEAVCGGETLAIRIPSHEGAAALLKSVDMPIVAPSANLSKHTSPVTAQHVYDDLNGKIELILDGGKCSGGIESTVLDVTGQVPRILRSGLITKEMIETIVGRCEVAKHLEGDKVKSPGVKYTHYRPKCETALYDYDKTEQAIQRYNEELALGRVPYIMCPSELKKDFDGLNVLVLGESGEEIASNLYDKLLEGEKKADIIIAIAMRSETGVFMGIMNRLRKSCG